MQKNLCALALAACAGTAVAQAEDAVVVTSTPLGSSLFELVQPADALSGRRLLWQGRSSLGETLQGVSGVSSSYFGPYVGRPAIRGLDGDRIRILQNGIGTLDASSLSFDHAVPYDPLVAERIEIVRGPASVLFGGNAVGGVVNLIDNRIPSAPLDGFTGRFEPRYGGASRERSLGAVLEAGNGRFAVHADGFDRTSKDLSIPGLARSARQRAGRRRGDPASGHRAQQQRPGRRRNAGRLDHVGLGLLGALLRRLQLELRLPGRARGAHRHAEQPG
jgi:iron complex outermembrane receptor protein